METAPLKSFATWARTALIGEVTARIAAVTAPGSSERVEQARAVAALEKAVGAAGGGRKGQAAVADKVAYIWFNRIIALRFMDANGYTGIGLVSPQAGVEVGQPEILAEAKRGVIDTEVVSQMTCTAVAGLLDGTRISGDPQGEAYALLLADYCRHWNRSMPFMFEREGDYTELLIPANLLADDSVLNRSVKVLTEDVCNDVEVLGWLYQFYISERKDEVFAGFKKNEKAGADEIPAATQLFTPHWIVRYLVENSLGRLWMLNRPSSGLVQQMDYYITPVDEETEFLKIAKPEDLKVIDPACGSGHMLTYAFDLLYSIYEEEGYSGADIPGLILANNLYGTEIDPRSGSLAAFALTMKARAHHRPFFKNVVEPNICVLDPISFTPDELDSLITTNGDRSDEETFWNQFLHADIFGSLIRPRDDLVKRLHDHLTANEPEEADLILGALFERGRRVLRQANFLQSRYHVVVANPPYMGARNMGDALAGYAETHFPNSLSGLDAMFIERALDLVVEMGFAAMITMHSWMFLASYEEMRCQLLRGNQISNLAHFGSGVFDSVGGEVVSVAASVIVRHSTPKKSGVFLRLTDLGLDYGLVDELMAAASSIDHSRRFERSSADFEEVRGVPIIYFANERVARFLKLEPLSNRVLAGVGTQTGDNARFVRYWFEVSSAQLNLNGRSGMHKRRWTLSTKGGAFRRWYNPTLHVMDWRGGGTYMTSESHGAYVRNAQLYFRGNLVWTKVGSKIPSFRFSDDRVVHNDASCFVVSKGASLDAISSYLNSRSITSLMKEISPTLNLTPGSFLSFPYVEISTHAGQVCREVSQRDWDNQELSVDFRTNELIEARSNDALENTVASVLINRAEDVRSLSLAENSIEVEVASAVGLTEVAEIPLSEHSLLANPMYRYGEGKTPDEYESLSTMDLVRDLVSYGVGCIFGRFSLDEQGRILANQGDTLDDFLAKIPSPTFRPDVDNVVPIVDGDWFEDDIVARFRRFLQSAFGEQHFEENLRFVTESLGVKNLRDYFVRAFYKDHVQQYKKRPIYWMFSSPKGSFNALIYMHRYTPSTVSTVLNEYLREFQAKLKASLEHAERSNDAKKADRLRKVLLELDEYEHDTLYPLASQNIVIDLDDGVKANYPKFGRALKKIPGLEASE